MDALTEPARMERLSLQEPIAFALYEEMAEEDVRLAEAGLADYVNGLAEADRAEADRA